MCFALSLKVDLVLNCCSRNAALFRFLFHSFHFIFFSHVILSFSLFFLFLFVSSHSHTRSLILCLPSLFLTRSVTEMSAFSQVNWNVSYEVNIEMEKYDVWMTWLNFCPALFVLRLISTFANAKAKRCKNEWLKCVAVTWNESSDDRYLSHIL